VSLCNQNFPGLGHDGNGGSTNGELTNESCAKIAKLFTSKNIKISKILDIGSSGGITLLRLAYLLDCIGVGVEIENVRYNISVVNNLQIINKFSEDVKVTFVEGDVSQVFRSFTGFDLVYMFDAVFNTQLMEKISIIFNRSANVKYILSTKPLDTTSFGDSMSSFNVKECAKLESLASIGGNIHRIFYLFEVLPPVGLAESTDATVINGNNIY
jgi:SAM-dependent methyltransferase